MTARRSGAKTSADALARTRWIQAHPGYVRCVPVYESDGTTEIGVFTTGSGDVDDTTCSPPDLVPTP